MPDPVDKMRINETLCERLSIPPRVDWTLSDDGGKTMFYHADTQADCKMWLEYLRESRPEISRYAKAEVLPHKVYPDLLTWAGMGRVVERMIDKGAEVVVKAHRGRSTVMILWSPDGVYMKDFDAAAPTAPEAVALAALRALGVEVQDERR